MTNTHYKIEAAHKSGLMEYIDGRGTINGAEELAERYMREHKRPTRVVRVDTEVVRQYDPANADYLQAKAEKRARHPEDQQ